MLEDGGKVCNYFFFICNLDGPYHSTSSFSLLMVVKKPLKKLI